MEALKFREMPYERPAENLHAHSDGKAARRGEL